MTLMAAASPQAADIGNFFTERGGQIDLMVLLFDDNFADLFG
jgi:hypothetical protein